MTIDKSLAQPPSEGAVASDLMIYAADGVVTISIKLPDMTVSVPLYADSARAFAEDLLLAASRVSTSH